jgi:hypothetical protein
MFAELERFVTAHRLCGKLTQRLTVGETTDTGYSVRLACSCGAIFERWVGHTRASRHRGG